MFSYKLRKLVWHHKHASLLNFHLLHKDVTACWPLLERQVESLYIPLHLLNSSDMWDLKNHGQMHLKF